MEKRMMTKGVMAVAALMLMTTEADGQKRERWEFERNLPVYADSLLRAAYDKSNDLRGMKHVKSTISWEIYQNYPEGQTSFLDDNYVVLAEYRVNEKTVQPQWSIVSDSVATILGYRCTLATTQFKGRKWLAWYTEDIPLNFGPWKLCGLPGLILRAYDSQRQYIFEAAGMSQPNGAEPIREVKNIKKYETLSLKDYLKALHEVTPGESLAALGIKIEGGDEEWQKDFDKFTKNVAPSNPIETEE